MKSMPSRDKWFRTLCIGVCALSSAVSAEVATITVPEDTDVTLTDAISAGYMSGVSDYDAFLTASDLVVNGPGRLIIETDLKSAGYTGEVHVVAGSVLQLRCTGALGDTAAGTFVEDGATLETYSEGEKNSLSFLGEPLTFAGTGVDGEGALVSLTTANIQRGGAWGGTALTMTGDALVRLKGAKSNFDFLYQYDDVGN